MSLITLESVKRQLDVVPTTAQALLIQELIDDAVEEAEREIGMKLNPVTDEIAYLDGDKNWLYVPHANISGVSIWEDLNREFEDVDLVASDDYTLVQERGIIKLHRKPQYYLRKNILPHRLHGVIKVQYDGGYGLPSVVIGTDGLFYSCIVDNVAASSNKPITGANYSSYWSQEGVDGVAWVSGTSYTASALPKSLRRALVKQIVYAFRRRRDLGLISVTSPDGTISKMEIDEWLDEVESVLNKFRRTVL